MKQNKLITFEGDLYLQDKKVWTNISNKAKTAKEREWYIKGMILDDLTIERGDFVENKDVNREYNKLMMVSHYNNNMGVEDISTNRIQFTNGYLHLDTGEIFVNKTAPIPFTPFQIPFKIFKDNPKIWNKKTMDLVDRFFKEVSGREKDFETGLLEIIGSAMAPINDSVMPIFYSPHKSSGKGTIMEIISGINKKTREIKGDQWWSQANQFSLSATRNQLTAWIDEVPSVLPEASTEKIKSVADSKRFMEIERKGIDQEKVLNTPIYIATTNNYVNFYSIDDSLKGRVMWFSFEMNQDGKMLFSKQEIKILTKDKEALEYIAYKAIKCYSKLLKRDGTRNEVFTKPKSHYNFWENVKDLNKAKEIIESDEILSTLWEQKVDFITNADINNAIDAFRKKNPDERITLMGFQTELISYIHINKLGAGLRSRDNKGNRGLSIKWNEDNSSTKKGE